MSRQKFAYFIGGPLDGQRRQVQELGVTAHLLHAEMPRTWVGTHREEAAAITREVTYRMVSRPVNPAIDFGRDGFDPAHIDAEIGVYHYYSSKPAR